MKTPTEIATSLEFFNEWRRKDEFITTKMPDPYKVGHDIDMAVMLLREHDATIAERDQLRAEFEKIAVIAAQTQDRNVSLKIERDQLRAELATERSRLDWMFNELTLKGTVGLIEVWQMRDYAGFDREAIDAAMKEDAK